MGHNFGKHKIWKGDCRETIPQFKKDYPNELLSLVWFDLNCYDPTKFAFDAIQELLAPGAIVAFWQLTRNEIRAESQHYINTIRKYCKHTLHSCETYPSLSYIICQ